MKVTAPRPGFVVAVAVYLLAVVGGLAAATFYAVVERRRAAHRLSRQEEAASAADIGLHATLSSWDIARRDSLTIGSVDSASSVAGGQRRDSTRVSVIRLTRTIYWIASAGRTGVGTSAEARRTQTLLIEVLRPVFPPAAALLSVGDVVVSPEFKVDGDDSAPATWTDCPPSDTARAPPVTLAPDGSATWDDGRPFPHARVDSAAAKGIAGGSLGRVKRAALARRATITVAPGAILSPSPDSAAACQPQAEKHGPGNWGEPIRTGRSEPCERFHPVVHALGDLTLTGGRGQGVLLVSGRLRIEGPFVFSGVVIATRGIDVTGPDVELYGLMVEGGGASVALRGTGALKRSTCAVDRVAEAAARAYPVPLRAWAELF